MVGSLMATMYPATTRQLKASDVIWEDALDAARDLGLSPFPHRWSMGELADIINKAIGASDNPELREDR
jgi:hypothetical protein